MAEDPAFYKRFSEMLEEAIRAFREQRISDAEYLIEISGVGHLPPRRVLPIPPLPISRTFQFEVVAS